MSNDLRNFLALSYEELEELNLKAKEEKQMNRIRKPDRRKRQKNKRENGHAEP